MLAVWGLNEIALGNYEQINYATIVEGRKMLWHDTYLPIDEQINEAFDNQWIRFIDKPRRAWQLKSDLSKVQALQADMGTSSVIADRFFKMGAPFTFACQLANIPLPTDTETKYPWLTEKPSTPDPFGAFSPSVPEESEPPAKAVKKKKALTPDELSRISDAYIERVLAPGESSLLKSKTSPCSSVTPCI
jgi:hypothetical protein